MRCDEIRDRLADRLDDLLQPGLADAVDAHLADCPACAERSRELASLREILYEKEEVGPPPPDLPRRVVAAAARSRAPIVLAFFRYAAVFLLGAGAAFAIRPASTEVPEPVPPVVVEKPSEPETTVVELPRPRVPRRIR